MLQQFTVKVLTNQCVKSHVSSCASHEQTAAFPDDEQQNEALSRVAHLSLSLIFHHRETPSEDWHNSPAVRNTSCFSLFFNHGPLRNENKEMSFFFLESRTQKDS